MKRFVLKGITVAILVVALVFPPVTSAFADTNPPQNPTTGQPGASDGVGCLVTTSMAPGNASSSPGAPFNEPGISSTNGGQADQVYAGNPGTASAANSNSTAAVAQYDIACLQFTQH